MNAVSVVMSAVVGSMTGAMWRAGCRFSVELSDEQACDLRTDIFLRRHPSR